ncbi:MAG TPA: hypothetical protein VEU73_13215 [Gemmatimonadales bacterium]|nr:hypothetical protein [Gemmatimonadales bacterium]
MPANALAVLDGIPPESIPAAIARLAARAMEQAPRDDAAAPDEQLSVDDAAKLLHVTRRFIWQHRQELGGVKLSERKLLLSKRLVLRYIERRRTRG